jgi:carbonic anhydrase/acetyltransferase-like protein (isoleucine patch superfamily)
MNGAVIGPHSLVGAQALIPEGKIFEQGAMIIGAPGRALKTLSDDQQSALLASSEYYQKNAIRFQKGLRLIE